MKPSTMYGARLSSTQDYVAASRHMKSLIRLGRSPLTASVRCDYTVEETNE